MKGHKLYECVLKASGLGANERETIPDVENLINELILFFSLFIKSMIDKFMQLLPIFETL